MHGLDGFRKQARYGAIILSVASAILTFAFGLYTNTNMALALTCAIALVVCSIGSDYIWLFVSDAWKAGRRTLCASLCAGALMFTGVNLLTNLGSVGWQRDSANQTAKLNTVAYDDVRTQIADNEATRKLMLSERERLISERGWTALVPSSSFNGRIEAAKLALDQEAKRGGCGKLCLDRKNDLAKLEADKAFAERLEASEKQLAGIDKVLADLKHKSAGNKPEMSAAKSQATFFAGLATVSLAPSETAEQWTNKAIAILIAVFLVFGPQVFSFIAYRPTSANHGFTFDEPQAPAAPVQTAPTPAPLTHAEPRVINTTKTVDGLITTRSLVNPAMLIQQRVQAAA